MTKRSKRFKNWVHVLLRLGGCCGAFKAAWAVQEVVLRAMKKFPSTYLRERLPCNTQHTNAAKHTQKMSLSAACTQRILQFTSLTRRSCPTLPVLQKQSTHHCNQCNFFPSRKTTAGKQHSAVLRVNVDVVPTQLISQLANKAARLADTGCRMYMCSCLLGLHTHIRTVCTRPPANPRGHSTQSPNTPSNTHPQIVCQTDAVNVKVFGCAAPECVFHGILTGPIPQAIPIAVHRPVGSCEGKRVPTGESRI